MQQQYPVSFFLKKNNSTQCIIYFWVVLHVSSATCLPLILAQALRSNSLRSDNYKQLPFEIAGYYTHVLTEMFRTARPRICLNLVSICTACVSTRQFCGRLFSNTIYRWSFQRFHLKFKIAEIVLKCSPIVLYPSVYALQCLAPTLPIINFQKTRQKLWKGKTQTDD